MNLSLQRQLDLNGYLTLNQFVKYLKLHAPESALSYPTALKLVNQGKLRGIQHGTQWRIRRSEIERWIAEGNYVASRSAHTPYNPDTNELFPEFKE